jgi:L,D-transpeptidase YcbB
MPGARFDRFLTSTAVVLLMAVVPVGAGAEPLATAAAAAQAEPTDQTPSPIAQSPAATVQPAGSDQTAPAITPAAASPQPAASKEQTVAPAAADSTATPAQTAAPPAAAETTGTANTPDTATPTAPALDQADAAIADQLHGLTEGKFDNIVGGKKDRMIIDAFYSGRNYQPLWITDGKANEHAKAAIAYLGHVDADGLDPADYPVPDFAALTDPSALAEAELRLSMAVITYAHHAAVGRIAWSRVSKDIDFDSKAPEPADVLAKMAETDDVATALDSYEPHTAGYLALKAKLAEIRAGKGDKTKPSIPNGPAPRIGAQDDRVPTLRDRLGVPGDGSTIYDKTLAEAVKKFQQEHELKATGTLTPATIEALNGRMPDRPTDIIIANMERWRWMPHDLGNTYVIVNLPDYTLRVMHDGKLVWMTKIVVGKPAMPTPIMTAEMKYITINPTWNVPPSIVNNEYLPALQQDPTVLERMGLRVDRNPDGTVHIWQPPGDNNALGRIRFNFPNKFLVYQHDTPDKYMFAYDKRAFSHGCMRVQDPVKYAQVLLSLVRPDDHYTEERIRSMYGNNEQDIQFPNYVPVNLTYQTAFVDDAGKLQFRDDIYGRDRAELALLKSTGEERKVADIPVEHRDESVRRQVLAIPDGTPLWGGGRNYPGNNEPGFFARLFGGFSAPPAAVPRAPVRRRVTRSGTAATVQ